MARKKDAPQQIEKVKIELPKLEDYIVKGDPADPTRSAEKFQPYRLVIDEKGNGSFSLVSPGGSVVNIGETMDAIIVCIPRQTTCSCQAFVKGAKKPRTICWTNDYNGYTMKGQNARKCGKETCPIVTDYYGKRVDGIEDGGLAPEGRGHYQKTLKKDFYFLVMDPDQEGRTYLARYSKRLKESIVFDKEVEKAFAKLQKDGVVSMTQAVFNIRPIVDGKNTFIDNRFYHVSTVSEEQLEEMVNFSKALRERVSNIANEWSDKAKKLWDSGKRDLKPAPLTATTPVTTGGTAKPKAASPVTPGDTSASPAAPVAPSGLPAAPGDDDLPF